MSAGTDLTNLIELEISKRSNGRMLPFRTNAGEFWGGKFNSTHTVNGITYTVLKGATRVKGLPAGFSDLLVIMPTLITHDMVGKTMAMAGFIEVKAGKDTVKPHQENFRAQMRAAGAKAGIARSVEDAMEIIG